MPEESDQKKENPDHRNAKDAPRLVLEYEGSTKRARRPPPFVPWFVQAEIGFAAWWCVAGGMFWVWHSSHMLLSTFLILLIAAIGLALALGICVAIKFGWRGFVWGVLMGAVLTCLVPPFPEYILCGSNPQG